MNLKKIITLYFALLIIGTIVPLVTTVSKAELGPPPTVKINIDSYTTVYEGDVIKCDITGEPTIKYWYINNQSIHTTFYGNNPVIFDPEPTPLNDMYVNLTVYAENEFGNDSDTVKVMIKRIFFGDLHFHTDLSDGKNDIDYMFNNAKNDNFLDFVAITDHAEMLDTPLKEYFISTRIVKGEYLRDFIIWVTKKLKNISEWKIIKDKVTEYYDPGNFSTILGFEYSASEYYPGGRPKTENGCEDVSHINFYYRDVYPDAPEFGACDKLTYDEIFEAMADEFDKGHLNFGFPHHPLGQVNLLFRIYASYAVNFSFLARDMKNKEARDKVLRGVEVYSRWGLALGKFSGIPIPWEYANPVDQDDAWVENGLWEWSENSLKNRKFVMMASSDTHRGTGPGIPDMDIQNHVCGISGVYSVHNKRDEIWDEINNCNIYGTQQLKIRANVRFDDQLALGRWINCTSPLKINVSALSTFSGTDSSGKKMAPHGYSNDELIYPIQDVWLVKKDSKKGKPWCKIIGHVTPNENLAFVEFIDPDVQPNNFYYVVIRQKGQEFIPGQSEYMVFLGPVFIENVV